MLKTTQYILLPSIRISTGHSFRSPSIPYNGGLPFIGTSLAIGAAGGAPKLHEYIDSRHKELGPIFRENMGSVSAVFISKPSLMRKIFTIEGKFPKHFVPKAWHLYNELHTCKRGLFFMEGDEWYKFRKLMNKYFLSPASISNLKELHEKLVLHFIQRWDRYGGLTVKNLEYEFYRHSISFVLGSLIGSSYWTKFMEYSPHVDELARKFQLVFATSSKLNVLPSVKLVQYLGLPVWTTFESSVSASLDAKEEIMVDRTVVRRAQSVVAKVFPISREVQTDQPPTVRKTLTNTGVQTNLPKIKPKSALFEHQYTQVPNFIPSVTQVLVLVSLLVFTVLPSYWLYNEIYVEKRFTPMPRPQDCCLCRMARKVVKMALGDLSENGLLHELVKENMPEDITSAIVADLLIAAGDTTAFTSQWAVYLLGRDRAVQDAVLRDPSLIRGVVKETLRLYPSAAFIARVLPNAESVDGYDLRKEELVLLSMYTAGRDSKLYPSADKFLPDRWSKDGTTRYRGVTNVNSFLPFAMGARSCIGARLATAQLNMTLTQVIQSYILETLEDTDMELRLVPVPSKPVRLKVIRR